MKFEEVLKANPELQGLDPQRLRAHLLSRGLIDPEPEPTASPGILSRALSALKGQRAIPAPATPQQRADVASSEAALAEWNALPKPPDKSVLADIGNIPEAMAGLPQRFAGRKQQTAGGAIQMMGEGVDPAMLTLAKKPTSMGIGDLFNLSSMAVRAPLIMEGKKSPLQRPEVAEFGREIADIGRVRVEENTPKDMGRISKAFATAGDSVADMAFDTLIARAALGPAAPGMGAVQAERMGNVVAGAFGVEEFFRSYPEYRAQGLHGPEALRHAGISGLTEWLTEIAPGLKTLDRIFAPGKTFLAQLPGIVIREVPQELLAEEMQLVNDINAGTVPAPDDLAGYLKLLGERAIDTTLSTVISSLGQAGVGRGVQMLKPKEKSNEPDLGPLSGHPVAPAQVPTGAAPGGAQRTVQQQAIPGAQPSPAGQGARPVNVEGLPEAGQAGAPTVQGLRGAEGGNAPRGLQPTAQSGVAVPPVPPQGTRSAEEIEAAAPSTPAVQQRGGGQNVPGYEAQVQGRPRAVEPAAMAPRTAEQIEADMRESQGRASPTFEQVYENAKTFHYRLQDDVAAIANNIGAEQHLRPHGEPKEKAGSFSKIARKGYPHAGYLTDIAATMMVVDTPQQYEQARAALREKYGETSDPGMKTTKLGYMDDKVLVRDPQTGAIGEVILVPRSMYTARLLEGGHELYDEIEKHAGKDMSSLVQSYELTEISRRLYGQARNDMREWDDYLSREANSSGVTSSAAPLSTSAKMSPDLTRTQEAPPSLETQPGELSAPSAITAGRPSQLTSMTAGEELTPSGRGRSAMAEPSMSGMEPSLEQRVAGVTQGWKQRPRVRVVEDETGVPMRGHETLAAAPTGVKAAMVGNELILVRKNIRTMGDVVRALAHEEAGGHRGVRLILGDQYNAFLDRMYSSAKLDPEIIQTVRENYDWVDEGTVEGRRELMDEYVAHLAETQPNAPIVKRIIAAVRRWLARYFPNMKVSDNDIRSLIASARKRVTGTTAKVGAEQTRMQHVARPKAERTVTKSEWNSWELVHEPSAEGEGHGQVRRDPANGKLYEWVAGGKRYGIRLFAGGETRMQRIKPVEEIKGRTFEEMSSRIPDESKVVSPDITKMIDGREFSEADLDEKGPGFLPLNKYGEAKANAMLRKAMKEAVAEANLKPELAAKIKVPSAMAFDQSLGLSNRSRYWYELSGKGFLNDYFDLSRDVVQKFIDVVASTSGSKKPRQNVRDAVAVMSQHLRDEPVTVGQRDPASIAQALSDEPISSHKFGNFAMTMQAVARLSDGKPLPTIDMQEARFYGLEPMEVHSNPVMYETIARHLIKVRDMQNALLPDGEQPYESWQIQSTTWVKERGTTEPDDYAHHMPELIADLEAAGIPVPGDKITMETLLDPRTAGVMAPTTQTVAKAPVATLETATKNTEAGRRAAAVYDTIREIDKAWAKNARAQYEAIQRTAMRELGQKRPVEGKKDRGPSIISELVSAIVGRAVDVTRVDPAAYGVYKGEVNPNVRIPLIGTYSGKRVELNGEQRAILNAVLGEGFKQESAASSRFTTVEHGEGDTFSVFVYRYDNADIAPETLAEFSNGVGFPVSYSKTPNGWLIDIQIGGMESAPDYATVAEVAGRVFSGDGVGIINRAYESTYGEDYVESSEYERLIRQFEEGLGKDADEGRGRGAWDSERRAGALDRSRKEIAAIAERQDAAFKRWADRVTARIEKDGGTVRFQRGRPKQKRGDLPPFKLIGQSPDGLRIYEAGDVHAGHARDLLFAAKEDIRGKPLNDNLKLFLGRHPTVSGEGQPFVFYHGTQRNLTKFEPKKVGTGAGKGQVDTGPDVGEAWYLTTSPGFASGFATGEATIAQGDVNIERGNFRSKKGLGGNVMPLYARTNRPLIAVGEDLGIEDAASIIKWAKQNGYDSIVAYLSHGEPNGGVTEVRLVVFSGKQLKSATGNTGAYSLETGDIRFQLSPRGKELQDRAIKEYGLTDDYTRAGYILPDGRMIDTGSRVDKGPRRMIDHREVAAHALGASPASIRREWRNRDMYEFMGEAGALRYDARAAIIDANFMPTRKQIQQALAGIGDSGLTAGVQYPNGSATIEEKDFASPRLGEILEWYGENLGEIYSPFEVRRPPPKPREMRFQLSRDVFTPPKTLDEARGMVAAYLSEGEILNPDYVRLNSAVARLLEKEYEARVSDLYLRDHKGEPYNDITEFLYYGRPDSALALSRFGNKLQKVGDKSHPVYLAAKRFFDENVGLANDLVALKGKVVKVAQKRAEKAAAEESATKAKLAGEYKPLSDALEAHRKQYIDGAAKRADEHFTEMMRRLARAGWDIEKAVRLPDEPAYNDYSPGARAAREARSEALRVRAYFKSITDDAGGGLRKESPAKRAAFIEAERTAADEAYTAWVYKMKDKVGKPVASATAVGDPWHGSTLTVTTTDGEQQVWHTKSIINYTKYGDPYRQFPSLLKSEVRLLNEPEKVSQLPKVQEGIELRKVGEEAIERERRGIIGWKETERLASLLGTTPHEIAKFASRKTGKAFNVEEIHQAANIVDQKVAEAEKFFDDMAERIKSEGQPSDKELAESAEKIFEMVNLASQFFGVSAEAGRALQIFRKLKGTKLRAEAYRNIIMQGGGRGVMAAKITALADVARVNKIGGRAARLGALMRTARHMASPTTWDKVLYVWKAMLLTGAQTHEVNIIGNVYAAVFEDVSTGLAAGIGKLHGGEKVSMREAVARLSGNTLGVMEGMRAAAHVIKTGQESGLWGYMGQEHRQNPFRTGEGELRGAAKITIVPEMVYRSLGGMDQFFKSIEYAKQLQMWVTRKHLETGESIDSLRARAPDDAEFMEQARKMMDRQTFQDAPGQWTRGVMTMLNRAPGLKVLAPFVNTPTNLVKYAARTTFPTGLLFEEVRHDLAAGGRARDLALARMSLGTSIMVLGYMMAAAGLVTGDAPVDKNERDWWRLNKQPYSFKMGDTWVQGNRLDPFALPFFMAADIYQLQDRLGERKAKQIFMQAWRALILNLMNKTYFYSMAEFIRSISEPGQYGENWLKQFAASMVPTLAAHFAKAQDPYVRRADTIMESVKRRIPGVSTTLPPQLNIRGEPIEADAGAGFWYKLFSPFRLQKVGNDPVANELERLGYFPGRPSKYLGTGKQRIKLTAQEHTALVRMQQQWVYDQLRTLIEDPRYQKLDDDEKIRAINRTSTRGPRYTKALREQLKARHAEETR